MSQERIEKLEDLARYMAEQFMKLVESNNRLLEDNLRLMKENEELKCVKN